MMDKLPELTTVLVYRRDTGLHAVQGYDLGLLAVTPDLEVEEDRDVYWAVTHLPTGYRALPGWFTFAQAHQAAAYAGRLLLEVKIQWHSGRVEDFDLREQRVIIALIALECGALLTDAPRPADVQELIDEIYGGDAP